MSDHRQEDPRCAEFRRLLSRLNARQLKAFVTDARRIVADHGGSRLGAEEAEVSNE